MTFAFTSGTTCRGVPGGTWAGGGGSALPALPVAEASRQVACGWAGPGGTRFGGVPAGRVRAWRLHQPGDCSGEHGEHGRLFSGVLSGRGAGGHSGELLAAGGDLGY